VKLVLVLVAGCGFSGSSTSAPRDGDPDAVPDMAIDAVPIDGAPGAARKKRITIPDAKVFENLNEFPIWLVIDDPAGLGAKATIGGEDIYFTRTDGTPLAWERIAWDKGAGHLEAWVRVSLVDTGANELDLRFGDPGPAHAPNAAMTWQNGFRAVWHMEDALGGNPAVKDAKNAVNGVAVGGPASATGKLGKGIDLDGNNDEITFTNPITQNNSSTISAWVRISQPANGFSSVMTVGNPNGYESRWFHTKFAGLAYGFRGDDTQTQVDVHNNQFTLLHWTYNGATKVATLYRDGAVVVTTNVAGTVNTQGTGGHIGNAPMQWGPGGNTPNFVNGIVDEVRIASEPRSAGWVRTEYENQRDVGAFFTLGADVPAGQ
jgi:Concanavalin A-like lectin/glucanases superfamily